MSAEPEVIIERMPDYEIRIYRCMSAEHRDAYLTLRRKLDEYILDFLAMNIRYFTSHGKRHSQGVIRQLSNLLPDEILKSMSSIEVLILLCGAWLHDIGLLVNRDENGLELSDAEIRECHHELSAWKIHQIAPWIGLDNRNLVQLLGDICACHRRQVNIAERLPQSERFIQDQRIRTHLLAALIRMADALDTDRQRAPELFEQIATLSDQARLHWRVCQMIELAYLPTEGSIHLDATYQRESGLTENDACDLIRNKCADLQEEWATVKEIFQAYSMPFTNLTASLTLSKGKPEQLNEAALNGIEILPLEIILYRQKRAHFIEQEQYLFASYWDCQSANLYEQQAQNKSVGSPERARALQQARDFYGKALALVQDEIPRQPPERYYLRTLERLYTLKRKAIVDLLNETNLLSMAEHLFLHHMEIAIKALSHGSISTQIRFGQPWTELDESHKLDFEHALRKDIKMPEYTGGHYRCCSCIATRSYWLTLAQYNKESEFLLQWLRERENGEWRTLGIHGKSDVTRTYGYTARSLRAFLEAGDQHNALKAAIILLSNEKGWLDNLETERFSLLANILVELFYFIRTNRDAKIDYYNLTNSGGWLEYFTKKTAELDGQERVKFLKGLILWREVPTNVMFRDNDQNSPQYLREFIRRLVCHTIQKEIADDPLWAESRHLKGRGQWYNRPEDKTNTLFAFWEYYLQAEDLEDFPRLAGLVSEKENSQ